MNVHERVMLAAAFAGCGGGGTAIDANLTTGDAPAGTNTIAGSVNGLPFSTAASTLWVGSPDNPNTDTVVYLFDHAIACAEITAAGWDTTITAGTKIFEIKMVGKTPQGYPTTTAASHIPASGESLSSFTVAAGTAADIIASGGTATLATIEAPAIGHFATGSFHVTFANGALDGTFAAPFCSAGREP